MFTRKAFQMASTGTRSFSTTPERLSKLRIGYIPGKYHIDPQQQRLSMPSKLTDPNRTLLHPPRLRPTTLRPRRRPHPHPHRHRRPDQTPENLRRSGQNRRRHRADGRLRRGPWQKSRRGARAWVWPRGNLRGESAALGDFDGQREARCQWRGRLEGESGGG